MNPNKLVVLLGLIAPLGLWAATEKTPTPKPYEISTCVVSGEKLGEGDMKPYTHVQAGQEIKFCCKSCLKDFQKDVPGFLKKLKEETAREKAKKAKAAGAGK